MTERERDPLKEVWRHGAGHSEGHRTSRVGAVWWPMANSQGDRCRDGRKLRANEAKEKKWLLFPDTPQQA